MRWFNLDAIGVCPTHVGEPSFLDLLLLLSVCPTHVGNRNRANRQKIFGLPTHVGREPSKQPERIRQSPSAPRMWVNDRHAARRAANLSAPRIWGETLQDHISDVDFCPTHVGEPYPMQTSIALSPLPTMWREPHLAGPLSALCLPALGVTHDDEIVECMTVCPRMWGKPAWISTRGRPTQSPPACVGWNRSYHHHREVIRVCPRMWG